MSTVHGTRKFRRLIESLESRRLLATVPGGFSEQIIATLGAPPTAMEFTPDGRLLVTQESGAIRVIKNNVLLATPAVTIPTDTFFERGLLGIAVDPNFATNGHIYTYHTNAPSSPIRQHLVTKWTMSGDTVVGGANGGTTLFAIPMGSAGNHNGGALGFGPDGKLYIAVGDGGPVPSQPQGLNTLYGKILRINTDGSIPTDNPFYNQATGDFRATWALGLRNPFTFAFQPGTGRMFINDVGSSGSQRREEINPGFAGSNYGWPRVEGFRTNQVVSDLIGIYTDPVHAYSAGGQAITGGAFYNPNTPMFPAAYEGDYFFGDYVSGTFRTINAGDPPPYNTSFTFGTGSNGPLDFDVAPDGSLWYLEYGNQQVRRVFVNNSANPSINNQPQNQTVSIDQPATFSVIAGGPNLTYQWQRNLVDIPGATGVSYTLPNPQLSDNGASFRVVVSNTSGSVTSNSATLTVVNNRLPNPVINTPSTSLLFTAGVPVSFSGSATDPEDGPLSASNFTWEVRYITGSAPERPFQPPQSGISSGSFTPATQTPYLDPDVAYRIVFTARDSANFTKTVTRDVLPLTSTNTIQTSGASVPLPVFFDGAQRNTPFQFTGVAGVIRALEAPLTQIVDGQTYQFVNWSNGGPRVQNLSTPLTNSTITANYQDLTPPQVTGRGFDYTGVVLPQAPHRIRFTFSEDVSASLEPTDLVLVNTSTNTVVPSDAIAVSWDALTRTATFTVPGENGGILASGNYTATLPAGNIRDIGNNPLPGNEVFNFRFIQGDADGNGVIDFDDYALIDNGFLGGLNGYENGDFNYDGVIDFDDYSIIDFNFLNPIP
jgi:glucose/arabinose dehydrogenase